MLPEGFSDLEGLRHDHHEEGDWLIGGGLCKGVRKKGGRGGFGGEEG